MDETKAVGLEGKSDEKMATAVTTNGAENGHDVSPTASNSPLTGCYLLMIIGEPQSLDHKDYILRNIAKGFLSWNKADNYVDLERELEIFLEKNLEGECSRVGERLIQYASESLVLEILINATCNTVLQCVRNMLSGFTRHRHVIQVGYAFAGSGSWVLQDGTFSYMDFCDALQDQDVQRIFQAYENVISIDIHCVSETEWSALTRESSVKLCKLRINPTDVLSTSNPAIMRFIDYITPLLTVTPLETLLLSTEVVGNIRFTHPTLYIFPGGQGDAALFGVNGFNMLIDGGFSRKACFWDFTRHLDRLDAILMTRINNNNICGMNAVLKRKRISEAYPQIGHFFCNLRERAITVSPDGEKDKNPLVINLVTESSSLVSCLRHLNVKPQACYRDTEPINLYHKVGHGTLDMYVLNPARDSREIKDFMTKWYNNDQKFFMPKNTKDKGFAFPVQNLVSICALLVWQPADPAENITRLLFPGSTPQGKIFEGLDRMRHLDYLKYPTCSSKSLAASGSVLGIARMKQIKAGLLEKMIGEDLKEIKAKPFDYRREKSPIERKDVPDKTDKSEEKDKIKPMLDNRLRSTSKSASRAPRPAAKSTVKKSESLESEKEDSKRKDLSTDSDVVESDGQKKDEKKKEVKGKVSVGRAKVPARSTSTTGRKLGKPEDKLEKISPTTPKKETVKEPVGKRINGITKDELPTRARITARSPSATPAKSQKDATNRRVLESKQKPAGRKMGTVGTVTAGAAAVTATTAAPTLESKPDKKPINKRLKSSPARRESSPKKVIRKPKEQVKEKPKEKVEPKPEPTEQPIQGGTITKKKPDMFREIIDLPDEPEEYLIVEKEEHYIVVDDEKKHIKDAEESEKDKKKGDIKKELSKEIVSQPEEKFSATSGATTAPTLPEDERITLDDVKEVVEEKHVKEDTREKEVKGLGLEKEKPVEKEIKMPTIPLTNQSHLRDIVKTPDEVADLPMHEEADMEFDDIHGKKEVGKATEDELLGAKVEKESDAIRGIEKEAFGDKLDERKTVADEVTIPTTTQVIENKVEESEVPDFKKETIKAEVVTGDEVDNEAIVKLKDSRKASVASVKSIVQEDKEFTDLREPLKAASRKSSVASVKDEMKSKPGSPEVLKKTPEDATSRKSSVAEEKSKPGSPEALKKTVEDNISRKSSVASIKEEKSKPGSPEVSAQVLDADGTSRKSSIASVKADVKEKSSSAEAPEKEVISRKSSAASIKDESVKDKSKPSSPEVAKKTLEVEATSRKSSIASVKDEAVKEKSQASSPKVTGEQITSRKSSIASVKEEAAEEKSKPSSPEALKKTLVTSRKSSIASVADEDAKEKSKPSSPDAIKKVVAAETTSRKSSIASVPDEAAKERPTSPDTLKKTLEAEATSRKSSVASVKADANSKPSSPAAKTPEAISRKSSIASLKEDVGKSKSPTVETTPTVSPSKETKSRKASVADVNLTETKMASRKSSIASVKDEPLEKSKPTSPEKEVGTKSRRSSVASMKDKSPDKGGASSRKSSIALMNDVKSEKSEEKSPVKEELKMASRKSSVVSVDDKDLSRKASVAGVEKKSPVTEDLKTSRKSSIVSVEDKDISGKSKVAEDLKKSPLKEDIKTSRKPSTASIEDKDVSRKISIAEEIKKSPVKEDLKTSRKSSIASKPGSPEKEATPGKATPQEVTSRRASAVEESKSPKKDGLKLDLSRKSSVASVKSKPGSPEKNLEKEKPEDLKKSPVKDLEVERKLSVSTVKEQDLSSPTKKSSEEASRKASVAEESKSPVKELGIASRKSSFASTLDEKVAKDKSEPPSPGKDRSRKPSEARSPVKEDLKTSTSRKSSIASVKEEDVKKSKPASPEKSVQCSSKEMPLELKTPVKEELKESSRKSSIASVKDLEIMDKDLEISTAEKKVEGKISEKTSPVKEGLKIDTKSGIVEDKELLQSQQTPEKSSTGKLSTPERSHAASPGLSPTQKVSGAEEIKESRKASVGDEPKSPGKDSLKIASRKSSVASVDTNAVLKSKPSSPALTPSRRESDAMEITSLKDTTSPGKSLKDDTSRSSSIASTKDEENLAKSKAGSPKEEKTSRKASLIPQESPVKEKPEEVKDDLMKKPSLEKLHESLADELKGTSMSDTFVKDSSRKSSVASVKDTEDQKLSLVKGVDSRKASLVDHLESTVKIGSGIFPSATMQSEPAESRKESLVDVPEGLGKISKDLEIVDVSRKPSVASVKDHEEEDKPSMKKEIHGAQSKLDLVHDEQSKEVESGKDEHQQKLKVSPEKSPIKVCEESKTEEPKVDAQKEKLTGQETPRKLSVASVKNLDTGDSLLKNEFDSMEDTKEEASKSILPSPRKSERSEREGSFASNESTNGSDDEKEDLLSPGGEGHEDAFDYKADEVLEKPLESPAGSRKSSVGHEDETKSSDEKDKDLGKVDVHGLVDKKEEILKDKSSLIDKPTGKEVEVAQKEGELPASRKSSLVVHELEADPAVKEKDISRKSSVGSVVIEEKSVDATERKASVASVKSLEASKPDKDDHVEDSSRKSSISKDILQQVEEPQRKDSIKIDEDVKSRKSSVGNTEDDGQSLITKVESRKSSKDSLIPEFVDKHGDDKKDDGEKDKASRKPSILSVKHDEDKEDHEQAYDLSTPSRKDVAVKELNEKEILDKTVASKDTAEKLDEEEREKEDISRKSSIASTKLVESPEKKTSTQSLKSPKSPKSPQKEEERTVGDKEVAERKLDDAGDKSSMKDVKKADEGDNADESKQLAVKEEKSRVVTDASDERRDSTASALSVQDKSRKSSVGSADEEVSKLASPSAIDKPEETLKEKRSSEMKDVDLTASHKESVCSVKETEEKGKLDGAEDEKDGRKESADDKLQALIEQLPDVPTTPIRGVSKDNQKESLTSETVSKTSKTPSPTFDRKESLATDMISKTPDRKESLVAEVDRKIPSTIPSRKESLASGAAVILGSPTADRKEIMSIDAVSKTSTPTPDKKESPATEVLSKTPSPIPSRKESLTIDGARKLESPTMDRKESLATEVVSKTPTPDRKESLATEVLSKTASPIPSRKESLAAEVTATKTGSPIADCKESVQDDTVIQTPTPDRRESLVAEVVSQTPSPTPYRKESLKPDDVSKTPSPTPSPIASRKEAIETDIPTVERKESLVTDEVSKVPSSSVSLKESQPEVASKSPSPTPDRKESLATELSSITPSPTPDRKESLATDVVSKIPSPELSRKESLATDIISKTPSPTPDQNDTSVTDVVSKTPDRKESLAADIVSKSPSPTLSQKDLVTETISKTLTPTPDRKESLATEVISKTPSPTPSRKESLATDATNKTPTPDQKESQGVLSKTSSPSVSRKESLVTDALSKTVSPTPDRKESLIMEADNKTLTSTPDRKESLATDIKTSSPTPDRKESLTSGIDRIVSIGSEKDFSERKDSAISQKEFDLQRDISKEDLRSIQKSPSLTPERKESIEQGVAKSTLAAATTPAVTTDTSRKSSVASIAELEKDDLEMSEKQSPAKGTSLTEERQVVEEVSKNLFAGIDLPEKKEVKVVDEAKIEESSKPTAADQLTFAGIDAPEKIKEPVVAEKTDADESLVATAKQQPLENLFAGIDLPEKLPAEIASKETSDVFLQKEIVNEIKSQLPAESKEDTSAMSLKESYIGEPAFSSPFHELRETHITTVHSPEVEDKLKVVEEIDESKIEELERKESVVMTLLGDTAEIAITTAQIASSAAEEVLDKLLPLKNKEQEGVKEKTVEKEKIVEIHEEKMKEETVKSQSMSEVVPPIISSIDKELTALGGRVEDITNKVFEDALQPKGSSGNFVSDFLMELQQTADGMATVVANDIKQDEVVEEIIMKVDAKEKEVKATPVKSVKVDGKVEELSGEDILKDIESQIVRSDDKIQESIADTGKECDGKMEGVKESLEKVKDEESKEKDTEESINVKDIIDVKDAVDDKVSDTTVVKDISEKINDVKDVEEQIKEGTTDKLNDITKELTNIEKSAEEASIKAVEAVKEIKDDVQKTIESTTTAARDIKTQVEDQIGKTKEQIDETINATKKLAMETADEKLTELGTTIDDIETKAEEKITNVLTTVTKQAEILEGQIEEKIEEKLAETKAKTEAKVAEVSKKVDSAVTSISGKIFGFGKMLSDAVEHVEKEIQKVEEKCEEVNERLEGKQKPEQVEKIKDDVINAIDGFEAALDGAIPQSHPQAISKPESLSHLEVEKEVVEEVIVKRRVSKDEKLPEFLEKAVTIAAGIFDGGKDEEVKALETKQGETKTTEEKLAETKFEGQEKSEEVVAKSEVETKQQIVDEPKPKQKTSLFGKLTSFADSAFTSIHDTFTDTATKLEDDIVKQVEKVEEIKEATVKKTKEVADEIEKEIDDIEQQLENQIQKAGKTISGVKEDAKAVKEASIEVGGAITETASDVKEAIDENVEKGKEALKGTIEVVKDEAEKTYENVKESTEDTVRGVEETFKTIVTATKDGISDAEEKVKATKEDVKIATAEVTQEIRETVQEEVKTLVTDLEQAASETKQAVDDKVTEVKAHIEQKEEQMCEKVDEMIGKTVAKTDEGLKQLDAKIDEVKIDKEAGSILGKISDIAGIGSTISGFSTLISGKEELEDMDDTVKAAGDKEEQPTESQMSTAEITDEIDIEKLVTNVAEVLKSEKSLEELAVTYEKPRKASTPRISSPTKSRSDSPDVANEETKKIDSKNESKDRQDKTLDDDGQTERTDKDVQSNIFEGSLSDIGRKDSKEKDDIPDISIECTPDHKILKEDRCDGEFTKEEEDNQLRTTESLSPLQLSGRSTPEIKIDLDVDLKPGQKDIHKAITPPTLPASPIVKELKETVASVVEYIPDDFSDEDIPGSPLSITSQMASSPPFSTTTRTFDPMTQSFFGTLPEDSDEELHITGDVGDYHIITGSEMFSKTEILLEDDQDNIDSPSKSSKKKEIIHTETEVNENGTTIKTITTEAKSITVTESPKKRSMEYVKEVSTDEKSEGDADGVKIAGDASPKPILVEEAALVGMVVAAAESTETVVAAKETTETVKTAATAVTTAETSTAATTKANTKDETKTSTTQEPMARAAKEVDSWGKPLGLPSPAPLDNKTTPKKDKRVNIQAKTRIQERKRAESPVKSAGRRVTPVYMDLAYVPHHGNANYCFVDFFKRVRARYYVFSGVEPSREVYNALLEAKQTWEDKDLEVTIIPTYDTDVLSYWVTENEELLTKNKIDLSPSASRCTINLQDHDTSCSAYRLEF